MPQPSPGQTFSGSCLRTHSTNPTSVIPAKAGIHPCDGQLSVSGGELTTLGWNYQLTPKNGQFDIA